MVQSGIVCFQVPPGAVVSSAEPGMNVVEEKEILNIYKVTYILEGFTSLPAVHLCLWSQYFKIRGWEGMKSQKNASVGPVKTSVDDRNTRNDDDNSAHSLDARGVAAHDSDMVMLKGHPAAVLVGAWNPMASFPATSSTDSTAMIWTITRIYNSQGTADAAHASNFPFLEH